MRGHKSVYYMTDSELREYKRALYRRRVLRNRILLGSIMLFAAILLTVGFFTISSDARDDAKECNYKYFKQITIKQGDRLWELADDYIDYSEYDDKEEYLAEVCSINHMEDISVIKTGENIVLPYFSSEFVY